MLRPNQNWTDIPPSKPGWYWRKTSMGNPTIIYFPHCGQYPVHWQKLKQDSIDLIEDLEDLAALDKIDWVRLYSGPIIEPE